MTDNSFYDNFYSFDDSYSTKNYRGQIQLEVDDWVKFLRNEIKVSSVKILHIEGGKEPKSFFWNGILSPFCINEEVKNLFESKGLTGVKYIPANVKNKSGAVSKNKYFAVCITGRIDAIDYLRSEVVFEKSRSGMIVPQFKGLYFDKESWDESDFFMTRPDQYNHITSCIYVSEKVSNLFHENNMSFIKFTQFPECLTACDNIIRDSQEFNRLKKEKIRKATPTSWIIQKKIDKKLNKNSIKWDLL